MRLVWRLAAILIMILPPVIDVVMAGEFAGASFSSRHPAWSSIEPPVLVMLGKVLHQHTDRQAALNFKLREQQNVYEFCICKMFLVYRHSNEEFLTESKHE